MNKTFKVIFNRARGTLMVANEITRSVQKKSTKTVLATAVALALGSTAAMAGSLQGQIWQGAWDSENYPTGVSVEATGRTSSDVDIYGVTVSNTASGKVEATADTTTQKKNFKIDVAASSQSGSPAIDKKAFGILSSKAKVTGTGATDPTFGGDSLTVGVSTNFTGGAAAADTTQYLNISAGTATLGVTASASNAYGVSATVGGRVDLGSSNSTTITSFVKGSNYTTTGNAYGIYADGKDSATVPTYSTVNLASKTAEINAISWATHTTGSTGVAVGVQIANGATVHAENTAADSTLTINGESLSTAVLIGVNSIGSTGIFNHANTTINLNTAANVTTAAVNATGIAVSNSTGVSTVTVGGNLTENVRSDTATATGISVDNNVATTGEGTTNTGVTVKGNTDITVTTKTGTAYGVDLDGYENTTTSSNKNYPAYVDFLGKTTEIKAKAEGYGDSDTPTVTGVNVTKGSVNFISRNDDKTVVADSQVKITATGKATDKTLAINANDDGVVTLNANKIEITSAGDGIKVNDDSRVYAVAGTLSSSNNAETLSFEDGSSISITSHDNAVEATDDSVVTLYAEDVDITVTGVLADAPTAVTLSDSSFVIGGKTISITSEGGTGIQAIDNGHVTIRSDYETKDKAVEGSSITINAYNEAIHAQKGTETGAKASAVNLFSETINIGVGGNRSEDIDAIILEDGEHSIVGKTTSITSTGNGIEVLEGAKLSIVDFDMAATSPTKFTEGSSLRIESNDEALYVNNASKVTLAASSVTLLSSTQLGTVQVENSGTLGNDYFAEGADAAKLTTVTINAKDLTVRNTYSSGSEGGFGGATFVAHSNTKLDVTADTLEVNAHNGQGDVVRVYGNAQVSITGGQLEDAEEGSSLAGNIVFAPETDGTADKKGTEAKVTLSLSGEDSEWAGRSYINNDTTSGGTTPTHGNTGNLYVNNTSLDVTLQDGATWTVTGNSFFNTINLYKGIVDASSESVKNFIGAGEGTEAGLIAVHGAKNELYINEDADIAGLHVAMMAQGADYGKPELIVDTVTAFDIKTTVDGTITEASNRLTFVTKDGVTEKGMLTIEEAFSINSTAFNATAGNDTQNEAIEHYNFLQGTLVTQNSATAEVETQLRLNKIQGELDSDGKAVGALLVKSGNRVDVMPYTTEDGAEEGKEKAASTALGTLTLEKGASFYATNNDSVTATKIETNTTGSSESQALVRIESTNADSDKRTVTTIGTLELATKDTFEAINNKSVKITTATVGEDANLTIKDVKLASASDDKVTPVTETEITTLNVQKGKFLADKNKSVKLETVNVASVDANPSEASVNVTNSEEVTVTTLNVGDNAKVSATGNKSVVIDYVKAGSTPTGDTDTGAFANIVLQKNTDVTVKNIATGASATVTVTDNTNTAQIGDYTGETLTGVISLGSKSTLTAQDASLYAASVTLADGDDTTKTKLVITGDAKDLTDGHYDNVKVSVTDLNLGNNSEVTLTNNKEVAITNVNAGSGITGVTGSNGTKAKMEVTGSENVTVDHLNLGQEATFDAKSNATVTVKNIETAASATVTVTENTNTAQIGDRTGETLTGVISLGSKSMLTAQDASLYATSVTLADGESDSAKTKLVITGDTKDATDSHYNNVTVAVTDLKLGNYSEVTLANNKSVTVGTITGATTGATATGDNAIVSITGSESVSIDSLKLGKKGTFIAQGNADVTVKAIETVAASSAENAATITIGGTEDATKNSNTAQIGSITLGDHTTMTATNAVVGEQANAVDVTVASNAKFTLTSEKATSYINNFDVNGEFTVSDATVNVQDLKGAGKVNVGVATTEGSNTTHTGANMYVKKLSMTGGSIYVDPVYGSTSVLTVDELNNGTLDTNITAGYGALVTIGAGSAESAIEAVKANVEAQTQVTNLTNAKSIVYISTPVTLGDNGSITVDPKATVAATNKLESDGTVSSDSVNKTVNVNNGGAIVVDQAAIGSGTVFSDAKAVTVVGQSDDATPVQSTLAVINVVAGSTLKLTDVENAPVTGNIVALTDSPYVTASVSSDHKTVSLTGTATDTGLSVIASMGVQSMLRRADMVLAESVADHAFATLDYTKGIGLWADVRGEQYKQTSLGHGAGFKTDIAYGTVGAEFAPTDATSLGVAFQYGKGTVKGDLYSVKNKTKNYGATIYGSTMIGATGVKLVGEVAYLKSDNEITNTYYTGLNQDLDADIFSAGLTVQKSFKLGSFDVTPSLGVRVSKLKTDDMRAGYSTIEEQSQTLVQIPVAVRFSTKGIETTGGWNIRPNLKLAVVPTFGDKDIEVYGNKRTVIDGSPFQGALGVNFTKGNFSINATANAGAGQHGSKAFGGKVGVNYRF